MVELTRVKEIFNLSWQLEQHRKNMIYRAMAKTKKFDIKRLEMILNTLNDANQRKKFLTQEKNEAFNKIDEQIKNFIEILTSQITVSEDGKISIPISMKKKYGNNEASKKTRVLTLKNKILKINNILDKINQKKSTSQIINKWNIITEELKNIIKDIEFYLSEGGFTDTQFLLKQDPDISQSIKKIELWYNILSHIEDNLPKNYGIAFERKLELFSDLLQEKAEYEIDKLIEEELITETDPITGKIRPGKKTTGDLSKSRGKFKSNFYSREGVETIKSFSNDDKYCKITAFDKRSGKMDLQFILPQGHLNGDNDKFRVSAKSWSNPYNRDFGTTSLFNAIARSAGFDDALAYGLVVGYYNPINKLAKQGDVINGRTVEVNFHEFAKTCIFLDVVMGYSQKNGYVDTIIIEDRLNNKIKVLSIHNILKNFQNKMDQMPGIVYNYNNLNIRGSNYLQWWFSKLYSQMRASKVSVAFTKDLEI